MLFFRKFPMHNYLYSVNYIKNKINIINGVISLEKLMGKIEFKI
jgi:hypothetical protein